MDIIRKIQYLLFCLLAIGFVACDDDDNNSTETGHEGILTQLAEEVDATAQQLWSSSPLIVNAGRTATLTKIQGYADKCKDDYFISYLNGFDQASTSMESSLMGKPRKIKKASNILAQMGAAILLAQIQS